MCRTGYDLQSVNFVDNFGELALFTDQAGDGRIKFHCKSIGSAAHHFAFDSDLVIKIKQGKIEYRRLVGGDATARADENTIGADAFNDVAEHAFIDSIFCNDICGPAQIAATILF